MVIVFLVEVIIIVGACLSNVEGNDYEDEEKSKYLTFYFNFIYITT